MKRYVRAELVGKERQDYVDNVKKEVETELDRYVKELDWAMKDDNIIVVAQFGDNSRSRFTFEPWRFVMNKFYLSSDVDIIVDQIKNYMKDHDIDALDSASNWELEWEMVKRKGVQDSDGFWTDYTLWHNRKTDQYACFFGDSDLYTPETSNPDAEFDAYEEAQEWFDDYKGFEEDEIVEDDVLEEI